MKPITDQRVYEMFCSGMSRKDIAHEIGKTETWVKAHLGKHRDALRAAGLPAYVAINGLRLEHRPWSKPTERRSVRPNDHSALYGPDRKPGPLMSEDEIAALYAGSRYDDYAIRASGKRSTMQPPQSMSFAGSSMGGLW